MLSGESRNSALSDWNPGVTLKERIKVILRPLLDEGIADLYADQILKQVELAKVSKEQLKLSARSARGMAK
jgi:hypothetical protein